MLKFNNIKKENVIYVGAFLTPESVDKIKRKGFPCEIPDAHMTLEFFGRRECDFPPELFGKEIRLLIDGAGKYEEDGVEKNFGLHISQMCLACNELPNGQVLGDVFKGDVPHITLRVSNGGKPVDTCKCRWWTIDSFFVKAVIGAVER